MVSWVFGKCHKALLVTFPMGNPARTRETHFLLCSGDGQCRTEGIPWRSSKAGGQQGLLQEKCEELSSLLVGLIRRGTRESAAQMLRLSLREDNKLWHF